MCEMIDLSKQWKHKYTRVQFLWRAICENTEQHISIVKANAILSLRHNVIS